MLDIGSAKVDAYSLRQSLTLSLILSKLYNISEIQTRALEITLIVNIRLGWKKIIKVILASFFSIWLKAFDYVCFTISAELYFSNFVICLF